MTKLLTVDQAFGEGGEFSYLSGDYKNGVAAVVRRDSQVLVGTRKGARAGRQVDYAVFPAGEIREGEDCRVAARRIAAVQTGVLGRLEGYGIEHPEHIIVRPGDDVVSVTVPIENSNPLVYVFDVNTGEYFRLSLIEFSAGDDDEPREQNGSDVRNPRFENLAELVSRGESFAPGHEAVLDLLAPEVVLGYKFLREGDVCVEMGLRVFDYLRPP